MSNEQKPIDMVLHCPKCHVQHIDAPEPSMMAFDAALLGGDWPGRWTNPPHRSHLCHNCGHVWRPADVATNGVAAVKTKGKKDSLISAVLAQPSEPEAVRRCIGGDSTCSCHDGDACHYRDCADGTKAWPLIAAAPIPPALRCDGCGHTMAEHDRLAHCPTPKREAPAKEMMEKKP